jgi:hypothetical protein
MLGDDMFALPDTVPSAFTYFMMVFGRRPITAVKSDSELSASELLRG